MITNFETNKVYFAKGLSSVWYSDAGMYLVEQLHGNHIAWKQLPSTESSSHIWARDYMPVQVSKEKFVSFRYTPDYLADNPEYKPDTDAILSELGINVVKSDIILDGGNVISCGDSVLLTDKIFKENPHYTKTGLLDKLTELLEAKPILIPWDKYEEYGHADGMVRYMGNGRVLLNNYCDFDKSLRKKLLTALSPHFEIVELHYGSYNDLSWAYINFLHVGRFVFVPFLHDGIDNKALTQIRAAMPDCTCIPIFQCGSIARNGGALNCVTWNTLEDVPEEIVYPEDA